VYVHAYARVISVAGARNAIRCTVCTGAYESECKASHVGIVLKCAVIYLYKAVAVNAVTCSDVLAICKM